MRVVSGPPLSHSQDSTGPFCFTHPGWPHASHMHACPRRVPAVGSRRQRRSTHSCSFGCFCCSAWRFERGTARAQLSEAIRDMRGAHAGVHRRTHEFASALHSSRRACQAPLIRKPAAWNRAVVLVSHLHVDPSTRVDAFTPPSRHPPPPPFLSKLQAQSFIERLSINPASIHCWSHSNATPTADVPPRDTLCIEMAGPWLCCMVSETVELA